MNEQQRNWNVAYWLLAVVAFFTFQALLEGRQVAPVSYSEFEQHLAEDRIAEVTITDQLLTGRLRTPEDGKTAVVAARVEPELAERLERFGVPYRRVVQSNLLGDVLSWVLPAVVFFAVWFFLVRRFAEKQGFGGFMPLGRSRVKVYVEQRTGVRFDDVAGVDEAKQELAEVVEFLKDPRAHGRLGARAPKGILLVGPPGTGKTLLARAVAGEAAVPFFSISGSEFVEMFVGVGAARVRDLFEQARRHAPAIVFIDELDALGRARGAFGAGGHDEKEQTLNQLLVEMDGFDPVSGVVILAATNRPEVLDPALLRAGRFDRQVLVDKPDRQGRLAVLRVHTRRVRLDAAVDLEQVAALTVGFSGADLQNLVNEAALAATREGAQAVGMAHFTAAFERIVAGLERRRQVLRPREREVVAHHEMGHALVALALPDGDPVHKVSIIPRGVGALGYTLQRPSEDRRLATREELLRRIAVLLAGRAAEQLVFGHLSTGAADDLARATSIAQDMAMRYGMDPALGHVAYQPGAPRFLGRNPEPEGLRPPVSEATQRQIDQAVRAILEAGFATALAILRRNRALLEEGARALLARETLAEEDLCRLAARLAPLPPEEAASAADRPLQRPGERRPGRSCRSAPSTGQPA